MSEYLTPELIKVGAFGFAAFLGMAYAYTKKWAKLEDSSIGWWKYMFGDIRKTFHAFSTLGILCVGAGGMNYLDTLAGFDIFVAGAGIGYLVPQHNKG